MMPSRPFPMHSMSLELGSATLSSKTGKVVTLKDIANVQTTVKGGQSRNDLMTVVKNFKRNQVRFVATTLPPLLFL